MLGVTRSAFYARQKRPRPARAKRDAQLAGAMAAVHLRPRAAAAAKTFSVLGRSILLPSTRYECTVFIMGGEVFPWRAHGLLLEMAKEQSCRRALQVPRVDQQCETHGDLPRGRIRARRRALGSVQWQAAPQLRKAFGCHDLFHVEPKRHQGGSVA